MSTTQLISAPSVENPNLETIVALTELAGLLSRNPHLRLQFVVARFDVPWENPRPTMEAIAQALSEHGEVLETADLKEVVLTRNFSSAVEAKAHAFLSDLGAVPAPPVYDPILSTAVSRNEI